MSVTGLAIIYIIIWWIVFFAILPIDVNRSKTVRSFQLGSKKQELNLIDALKIACRKYSKEKTGKKPFTNINLVRI